jgi:two-component system phosphate regulon sensor histidine kinase PhoR
MFFRRLFTSLALLVAGMAVVLSLVFSGIDDHALRSRLQLWLASISGAALLAAVGLAAWLSFHLTRSLRELEQAVEKMGHGETGLSTFTHGPAEIDVLRHTCQRVSERLAQRITQLEQDRQQLRTILSGMVEGVVALDAEQRILFANDRAAHLLELPSPAPVGRRIWEIVRQRPLLDLVKRALDSTQPQREELSWNGMQPRSLTVHAACLPADSAGGAVRGAVLVLHDTSELRRLERLRQELVANVSHELKTPLSVIKVCVETLIDGAIDDPQHRGRFLEQIASHSDRLHALILDLLSLARIESGEEVFNFQAVGLGEVGVNALERHRPRAESRGHTLTLHTTAGSWQVGSSGEPPLDDVAVWADEEAIEQILDNLLDNAVKYTPDGGRIDLSWQVENGSVSLRLSDTGIGIPEADLPRIFERFYRVDKARSREMGGTGLGLSIIKHLVQAMQGTVSASSRVGVGTTFTICLPRANLAAPRSADAQDSASPVNIPM